MTKSLRAGCPILSGLYRKGWGTFCGSKRSISLPHLSRSLRHPAVLCALSILLLPIAVPAQSPTPKPTLASFAYDRQIILAPETALNQSLYACAVLDANVFAHTNGSLGDLRLFDATGKDELPYAVTLSRTSPTADPARILNLGLKGAHQLSFDLQMPSRPYSSVDLTLNAQDFLAAAKVTGLKSLNDKSPTFLGTFTLFDLTGQRLGRNTSLAIAESTFPYLHLELDLAPAPGNDHLTITPAIVAAAEIPPSREAQTVYTTVAQTFTITQRPRQSVATFTIPAHVPIERVSFELDPADPTNFSRPVTITAKATPQTAAEQGEAAVQPEQLSGSISRVQLTESGQTIHEQSLSVPAILGSNEQYPATIEVAIENGDDQPLNIRTVRLEMRQRKLCFNASAPTFILAYGAPNILVPVYDFERTFNPAAPIRVATISHEQRNSLFIAHTPKKSFTERYPQLLWITLLLTVSILGLIAFRSAKRLG
jgi:hypothetical protein